ncbi:MAG: class C beta-lactamase-related serine hydrolase [Sphingobium sp.]|nr:class C beta-lactamase-related serine hydrolase [Sphingobium sp.]
MTVLALAIAILSVGLWMLLNRTDTRPVGTYMVLKRTEGVSRIALNDAAEPLFQQSAVGTTQALIVMRDGEIILERYGDGIGPTIKLPSHAIAKAVTASLVGLMVSDGRLSLDMPVPVRAWNQPGDPRGTITLRHLLQMTSGLDHQEITTPAYNSDRVRMLFTDGVQDMAAFAEAKPIANPPGSSFTYSTGDTLIIADLMTRMLTDSQRPNTRRDAMMEFVKGRLMDPVGLPSLTPEFDAHGTMIGGAMMHMTARDYARFGDFLRRKGRINGHQVLSARWVEFMTTASERNPAFGGHIWLNREGAGISPSLPGPLFPGKASKRIFAAVGHQGQYLLVSPAQRLVILRIGLSEDGEQSDTLRSALIRLIQLFPST